MPKAHKPKGALKKARELLNIVKNSKCESSDTEESIDSLDSGDFAHIPIKDVPSIENLLLESEEDKMEDITTQLQKMMKMMEDFSEQQKSHQTRFEAIETYLNETAEETPQPQPQPTVQRQTNVDQLFKIPDPIKMLPTYDGNVKQLNAWLATAEETLNAFKDHVTPVQYKMYVTAVTNKIQGRAKDAICLAGNPDNFANIKEILVNTLGDRQEISTYKCQLWQCKMTEGMSIARYYNKSKALVQNIKALAKQKDKYKNNWEVINDFIDEDALAAFIAGLSEPYFGYAQAARPRDVEDAYAFLCKFKSKEVAHNMTSDNFKKSFQRQKDFEYKPNHKGPQTSTRNPNPVKPFKQFKTDEIEPMDATTTRSRLTINKRTINNHETINNDPEVEILEDSESENESDDELDLNFHSGFINQNQT